MQLGKAHTINKACDMYLEVKQDWFTMHRANQLGFSVNDIWHFSLFNLLEARYHHEEKQFKFKKHPALILLYPQSLKFPVLQLLHHRLNMIKNAYN